jgi:hypothetical protein
MARGNAWHQQWQGLVGAGHNGGRAQHPAGSTCSLSNGVHNCTPQEPVPNGQVPQLPFLELKVAPLRDSTLGPRPGPLFPGATMGP